MSETEQHEYHRQVMGVKSLVLLKEIVEGFSNEPPKAKEAFGDSGGEDGEGEGEGEGGQADGDGAGRDVVQGPPGYAAGPPGYVDSGGDGGGGGGGGGDGVDDTGGNIDTPTHFHLVKPLVKTPPPNPNGRNVDGNSPLIVALYRRHRAGTFTAQIRQYLVKF